MNGCIDGQVDRWKEKRHIFIYLPKHVCTRFCFTCAYKCHDLVFVTYAIINAILLCDRVVGNMFPVDLFYIFNIFV